jgi:glycosidase
MGDDLALPERTCARTSMQWSKEPHGGFTKCDRPTVSVIQNGPYGYERINAAVQRRDPDSLLNWTERIIRMRKEVPETLRISKFRSFRANLDKISDKGIHCFRALPSRSF